jgi:hypothetical protein
VTTNAFFSQLGKLFGHSIVNLLLGLLLASLVLGVLRQLHSARLELGQMQQQLLSMTSLTHI